MTRNVYSLDFKKQVLREAEERGNIADVARKHGINIKLAYKWKGSLSKANTNQYIEPNQPQSTVKNDLQIFHLQLEEIQSRLDLLNSNDSHDQFTADIKASTARMESGVRHTLMEIQGQIFEMMKTLSQLNRTIGHSGVIQHSKDKTTTNIHPPIQPIPKSTSSNFSLDEKLELQLDRLIMGY